MNIENNSQSNQEETDNTTLQWSPEIDTLLAGWCDNAKCYEWMHTEASEENSKKAKKFMIAINLLTAISGVSNIIAGGMAVGYFQISWLFGTVSVLTSTLNIIQNKLGYQTLAEAHKKTAMQWSRIISKIEEVVILPPLSRTACKPFMKYIKSDINHATLDGDCLIPKHIREACYNKFNHIKEFDIPDVCGQVEHTKVFNHNIELQSPLLKNKLAHKSMFVAHKNNDEIITKTDNVLIDTDNLNKLSKN